MVNGNAQEARRRRSWTRFGPSVTFVWVLGVIGATALIAILVATWACGLATCQDKTFRLEVAKASLQILVVTVIGGLATFVTGAFKNAFDAANADQQARRLIYNRLVQAYREVKFLRRRLRTQLNQAPQAAAPKRLMAQLESIQLEFEQLKWEAPTLEAIFESETKKIAEGLQKIEQYLRKILREWENNPARPLAELTSVEAFAGPSAGSFKPGVVSPYISVRNAVRVALRMGAPHGQGD